MDDFRRILLTTDLSEESWAAFGAAASLAERYDAELVVVSIVLDSATLAYPGLADAGAMIEEFRRVVTAPA